MRMVAATLVVAAALNTVQDSLAADGYRAHGSTPTGVHEKDDARTPRAIALPGLSSMERRPDGTRRHRVTAIVYVPAIRSPTVPFYYLPSAPSLYLDPDPPDDAYRDPSGFYYWCPDPAGYYPYQPECPVGWRLVAP